MPHKINLRLSPHQAADEALIHLAAARKLQVAPNRITACRLLRRSVDARGTPIVVDLMVQVFVDEPFADPFIFEPKLQAVHHRPPVLIAGAGPAGLFAALQLIEAGFRPIIIERGNDVRKRRRDLAAMNKQGIVNPESNYCFGEGGAGTYSDGKLYTRATKRGNVLRSLQWFRHFGASENILYEAHPHIGTNKLPAIISAMSEQIRECGGEILFQSRLTDLLIDHHRLKGVQINGREQLSAHALILATGHSARDIFQLLHRKRIALTPKPFALGVRVEHPQPLINRMQYHGATELDECYLEPASYNLVHQTGDRAVFSFCMCPGGIIAPASTTEGALVVNGWSPSKRNNPFANSGIVVTVDEKTFLHHGYSGPLAGMHYQEMVETNAWEAGGGRLQAPAQRMTDFVSRSCSATLPECSYLPGITSAALDQVLPAEIFTALRAAFLAFGKKRKGYFTGEALVVATESRTSAPVRIPRYDLSLQHHQIEGLFPAGEGAGYAGGIISAAMDGARSAMAVSRYLSR